MAFDYTDGQLSTPLIQAVVSENPEQVNKALNRGFSANLQDNRGWTPLHVAAQKDARSSCFQVLLNHESSNINSQTFEGETPLFKACQNDSLQIAEVILKNPKCNINLPNNEGVSPLHVACSRGNERTLRLLLDFGHNVNAQDYNGYTPLHETVSQNSLISDNRDKIALKICKYLVEHGANPDLVEDEGNLPFHLACQAGFLQSANFLLSVSKQRDLVNHLNCDGRSPLMMAVSSKNLPTIKSLLSQGANPNIADKSDITPLHLAAHSANYEIFNLIHKATSKECILKYCTFNEDRALQIRKINSVICLAIDTEDLLFLAKVLASGLSKEVLQCPIIHAENPCKKCFTLHSPVSFLLESKMCDLGEKTLDFLNLLIKTNSPLVTQATNPSRFNYIDPICAAFVAMNDCPTELVLKCLAVLLNHGADPDEPRNRVPYSIEQACMRNCSEALLLLLRHTNFLEAEDILTWIESETSADQLEIITQLLPLAPYYTPSEKLLPDVPGRASLLAPKVFSLASHCCTVVRRQLRAESSFRPTVFKKKLLQLNIPKSVYSFLRYY